jgi:hypothetical protein
LNIYYGLAIVLGALAALMGYLGQKHEGDKQSSQVRDLLDETRGLIAEAKSEGEPVAARDVDSLEARYLALAQKFQAERPSISAQLSARKASREADQVTASAALLQPVRSFSAEAIEIAKAFSADSTRWRVQFYPLPDNIVAAEFADFMTYGIENHNTSYVGTIQWHADGLHISFARTAMPHDYWLDESHSRIVPPFNRQSVELSTYDSGIKVECDKNAVDVCDLILASDEYKELIEPDGSIPMKVLEKAMLAVFLGTIRHELAVLKPPQASP